LFVSRCKPCYHGVPVESNIAAEAQAWDWIAAADAGFFIDPGFGNHEPCGDFFGCEYVFGLKADAYVEKMKLDRVGDLWLIARGTPRPCERAIEEVTHRVHVYGEDFTPKRCHRSRCRGGISRHRMDIASIGETNAASELVVGDG
jgi:hypothetical protein